MFRPLLRNVARQSAATLARPVATRELASNATLPTFNWEDPLNVQSQLTEEELAISETAEAYCQQRILPRVLRKLSAIL